MRKLLLICLLLGWLLPEATAQQQLSGKVTDAFSGEGLPGVNVMIQGTRNGTVTDLDGNYKIQVPGQDAVLEFSFIGFVTQAVPVGSKSTINVALEQDVKMLNEVVKVGYGEMKKTDLSSAQVAVSSKDIEKTVNTTLEQALQGRAANVYVSQNSGQPGGGMSINIRGVNSISGNTEPMYVIDGVQIMGGNGMSSSVLSGINPDDIESMNILQGPSATSIYGSRAANGVIVITTKRGQKGRTKVSYAGLMSAQTRPDLIPVMNLPEYAAFQNEIAKVNNIPVDPLLQDPSILDEGTNWQDELFRVSPLMKHQLTLSGGSEKTTFYLSGEYFDQEGVAIGSGFKRYSVRLNLENQTRDWLKIGANLSANNTNEVLTISNDDILNIAISQGPNVPLKNPDGSWGGPTSTQFRLTNPVALAMINDNRRRRMMALGNFYTDIELIKGLTLRNELNGNIEYRNDYNFSPSYQFGGFVNNTTTSSRSANNSTYWALNTLLRYNVDIGAHHIEAMASHEAQESNYEGLSGARNNFVSNNVQELVGGDATTATNGSSRGSWAMESYLGRLNYIYNDKYILQATLRADGSPNFGPNNRWGYFPAVSGAWRVGEEAFLEAVPQINELKLRAEYGITGNQSSGGATYFARLNGVPTPWGTGFLYGNFNNPDFQWEETATYNVGIDFYLFNNRVQLIADAYLKQTDNLMMQTVLPSYLGANTGYSPGFISNPWANVGSMENKGFGITLNTVPIEGDLSWNSGLNFSMDRNQITDLYRDVPLTRDVWFMNGFLTRSEVGLPAWQFYGYEALGLFQSVGEIEEHARQTPTEDKPKVDKDQGSWVGDVKFKDQNNDGVIDEQDRVIIGNPWPKFTFGFTNTVSYKNFELTAFLTGVYGNDVFNYARYRNTDPNGGSTGNNYYKAVMDYAKVEIDEDGNPSLINPETTIPRITTNGANGSRRPSDWFVEDGSFVRIKNLQLAYRLPQSLVSRASLGGVRVAANVQNLYTFTNYTGYDPEVGTFDGSLVGVDYGRYPSTRMYTFSLQVDF